jgi:uncharacterized protein (DUF1330 family)
MSAHVISEVEIIDNEAADHYREFAASSIKLYGGNYLARGANAIIAEGNITNGRIVIVEFPSMKHIDEWYASPEYAEALKYRDKALIRRLMFVDGIVKVQ